MRRARGAIWVGGAAIVVSIVVFLVPFAFIVLTALKDRKEASLREFSLPANGFHLWDNLVAVIKTRDYMLLTAFINSIILTVASVRCSWSSAPWSGSCCSDGLALGRRFVNFLVLAG